VEKMILLAPAINLMKASMHGNKKISLPVTIYHGKNDAVIPLEQVQNKAREIFLHLSFHVADDDHFLHNTFKTIDWEGLLS
jgi:hypothetical protein